MKQELISFKKSGDVIEWRYWKYNDTDTQCSLLEIGKFSTEEEYKQLRIELPSLGSALQ